MVLNHVNQVYILVYCFKTFTWAVFSLNLIENKQISLYQISYNHKN